MSFCNYCELTVFRFLKKKNLIHVGMWLKVAGDKTSSKKNFGLISPKISLFVCKNHRHTQKSFKGVVKFEDLSVVKERI